MSEKATCQLCGEPMPAGEEMFKYHGYSGPCPKPPLPPANCCGCSCGHCSHQGGDNRHTDTCADRVLGGQRAERLSKTIEELECTLDDEEAAH